MLGRLGSTKARQPSVLHSSVGRASTSLCRSETGVSVVKFVLRHCPDSLLDQAVQRISLHVLVRWGCMLAPMILLGRTIRTCIFRAHPRCVGRDVDGRARNPKGEILLKRKPQAWCLDSPKDNAIPADAVISTFDKPTVILLENGVTHPSVVDAHDVYLLVDRQ